MGTAKSAESDDWVGGVGMEVEVWTGRLGEVFGMEVGVNIGGGGGTGVELGIGLLSTGKLGGNPPVGGDFKSSIGEFGLKIN